MDIRAQRTRAMLKDALSELLSSKSFEDVTVSEICELSTVRRGTFYRHFVDKYAFYEWYLESITEQFLSEFGRDIPASDIKEYASYMHARLIKFAEQNRAVFGNNFGETALAGSLDMVMRQAAVGIADHILGYAEANGITLHGGADFISLFYCGGMVHTLRWWLINDKPCSAEELERNCTDFLMRYLDRTS